jgi:uncharacterized membrane protein SpoIIM required for sporulation
MLEQLFPPSWLERKAWFAFVLGFSYAVLGIASGLLLFPKEPALAAVAFTSLLTLPSLNRMLSIEARQAERERHFTFSSPFKDHLDIFEVYVFLFLGVMLAFSAFSLFLPGIAGSTLFADQIREVGLSGSAMRQGSFGAIFSNNLIVFAFALIASFVYGSGAVFIIIWNASVWGVVLAFIAREAATAAHTNPMVYFALTLIAVGPHLVTEASAYVLAAISGGIVSKAAIKEKPFSTRFTKVVKDALVIFMVAVFFLVIAAYVESHVTGKLLNFVGV